MIDWHPHTADLDNDPHVLPECLRVPPEYCCLEAETDALKLWKNVAYLYIRQLQGNTDRTFLSTKSHTLVMRLAALTGDDIFSTPPIRHAVNDILDDVVSTIHSRVERRDLFRNILELDIKPLFLTSAHPRLNLETGRRVARPAGGDAAKHDFFQDQTWKREGQGCWNAIRWCVEHMDGEDIEPLWPLLVPPLMTLVDDYEPPFKLRGILAVDCMLERVDARLLKRTGLDVLLLNSLSTAMAFISTSESPALFVASAKSYIRLVKRATEYDSQKRYDRLWELISAGIIGGAWVYGMKSVEMTEASVEVLTAVIPNLGVASVRFLKALVPQLSEYLTTKPEVPTAPRLQLLSSQCLSTLLQQCGTTGLISAWRHRILDGLLRCWVETKDKRPSDETLLVSLRKLAAELVLICPEIRDNEIPRLVELDNAMFHPLFEEKGSNA